MLANMDQLASKSIAPISTLICLPRVYSSPLAPIKLPLAPFNSLPSLFHSQSSHIRSKDQITIGAFPASQERRSWMPTFIEKHQAPLSLHPLVRLDFPSSPIWPSSTRFSIISNMIRLCRSSSQFYFELEEFRYSSTPNTNHFGSETVWVPTLTWALQLQVLHGPSPIKIQVHSIATQLGPNFFSSWVNYAIRDNMLALPDPLIVQKLF